jgi:hypothetical protein
MCKSDALKEPRISVTDLLEGDIDARRAAWSTFVQLANGE